MKRLTAEQAKLLHEATDRALMAGACTYRTERSNHGVVLKKRGFDLIIIDPIPCCVIGQADALRGGSSWRTVRNGQLVKHDWFPALKDINETVLIILQQQWDSAMEYEDDDERRRVMHAYITGITA